MSRAPGWKEGRVPRWKKQLREWGRHKDWYLSMPLAHLLYDVAGYTSRPKEELYREAREELGRVVFFLDVVTDHDNDAVAEYLCDHVNAKAAKGATVQNLAPIRLKEVAVAAET